MIFSEAGQFSLVKIWLFDMRMGTLPLMSVKYCFGNTASRVHNPQNNERGMESFHSGNSFSAMPSPISLHTSALLLRI